MIWIVTSFILILTNVVIALFAFRHIRKLKVEIRLYRNIIEKYNEERNKARREAEEKEQENDVVQGVVPPPPAELEIGTYAMRDYAVNKGLYDLILQVMQDNKPYADENFDIDRLVELVKSNRTYVSRAINTVYGKNFRAWLADYRNAVVVRLLKKDPHVELPRLAHYAGYSSVDVLKRQFSKLNGMTLAEFRAQLFD